MVLVSVDRLSPLQSHTMESLVIQLLMPVPARRVWMGWESPIEGLEALLVQPRGAELVLLLALRSWMVGRSPQQPPLVRRDAEFFPTPRTLDISSPWLALVHRVSWGHQQAGSPDSDHPPSQEGPLPGTPPHWRRRGSTLPPPSTPSHSWQAGMASLQQADQCPLPIAGGPWHMLLLSLREFL